MQKNNILYKRINRFSNNTRFVKEEYNKFDFNNNLKSNKIEELKFTNYLSSNRCNKYFLLLEICAELYKNNNSINKIFVLDEFDPYRYHSKRVYDIMNTVNYKKIKKKTIIYKLKSRVDPAIQFYVVREKNILKLCLIDIYHIVIETVNKKIGKADRVTIYSKREKCNYDIKNIQKKLNKYGKKA